MTHTHAQTQGRSPHPLTFREVMMLVQQSVQQFSHTWYCYCDSLLISSRCSRHSWLTRTNVKGCQASLSAIGCCSRWCASLPCHTLLVPPTQTGPTGVPPVHLQLSVWHMRNHVTAWWTEMQDSSSLMWQNRRVRVQSVSCSVFSRVCIYHPCQWRVMFYKLVAQNTPVRL